MSLAMPLTQLSLLEPVSVIRGSFLAASLLILIVYAVPFLRDRLLAYGSRLSSTPTPKNDAIPSSGPQRAAIALLDYVASMRVPHSYFTHFYMLSVVSSLVWAQQILTRGPLFTAVAANVKPQDHSMGLVQVAFVWFLMLGQGSRRLYECMAFARPTKSRMWFGHWMLGLLFYLCMGVAVWIEGVPALKEFNFPPRLPKIDRLIGPGDILAALPAPRLRTFIFVPFFLIASGMQYDTHFYLSTLPKPSSPSQRYTRPTHGNFALCVTPHYFSEIQIYLSLAFLAAPEGCWINRTVLCGVVFVAVNLGVTAIGTREFWIRTWGPESVQNRARMIPLVW